MTCDSKLLSTLQQYDQEHLVQFWDDLTEEQQANLAAQIAQIDFELVARLSNHDQSTVDYVAMSNRAEPPHAARVDGSGTDWSIEDAVEQGDEALASGKIGMMLVAGGQGSRLGFDKPKGLFPIGPISNRTLFQIHADQIKALSDQYGIRIPLYIMTSPATHEATVEYIKSNNNLGLPASALKIFCQGSMPAIDLETGKLLLASKHELALSPDGHGGTVSAFAASGCLKHAIELGIEHLCYAQIDNPLANPCDAALVGHHILAQSDMTTQVVQKRDAFEKVGNVVHVDGKVQIIEYIHLPENAAKQTNPDGSLKLWAGNIAVHIFKTSFLESSTSTYENLPFNRAIKQVPFVDSSGQLVQPTEPNAIKFERFIFDLLPSAKNAFVVEGLAAEVFAPVKNADGAPTDTPQASKQAISDLHRSWLVAAGAIVDETATIEIHPNWAVDPHEVALRINEGDEINGDRYFQRAPDDDSLVIATRCNSAHEANMILIQLGNEGIRAFVEGENTSITLSNVAVPSKGIPVLVRKRDAERAASILG